MTLEDYEIEIPKIYNFLVNNVHLFKKPSALRKNDWPSYLQQIKDLGMDIHPLHGKCFHISKFVQHYFGKEHLELRCIKPPFTYIKLPCGHEIKTTHWFLVDKQTGDILDLTEDQFIYGYEPDYFTSVKSDMAYPYFGRKGTGHIYDETVPSLQVIKLGKEFQKQYGTSRGLDIWIERFDKYYEKKDVQMK